MYIKAFTLRDTLCSLLLSGALIAPSAALEAFPIGEPPEGSQWAPEGYLEPESISMSYWDYSLKENHGVRDTYLAPIDKELKFGLGVDVDYTLVRWEDVRIFWDNHYFFDSTTTHVKHVGWKFFLGIALGKRVEMGYRHMSRHIMEESRPMKYPTHDSFMLKFNIYDRER